MGQSDEEPSRRKSSNKLFHLRAGVKNALYYTLMMHRDVFSEIYSEVVFLLTHTHTHTQIHAHPHTVGSHAHTLTVVHCAPFLTHFCMLSLFPSLFCTFSLSTPMPGSSATHIALGLCLRSEDMEHLCGSTHLTVGQRMGQGLSGLYILYWTHTHTHTHCV